MKTRSTLIFPDVHLGHHDAPAVRVALKLLDWVRPERVVFLGDVLDAHSASSHGASDRREKRAPGYLEEVRLARRLLDHVEGTPGVEEVVFVEGNHEQRVERWAVSLGGLAEDVADVLSPQAQLSRARQRKFTWVPYVPDEGRLPFHTLAPGLIACHGYSTAIHAAAAHLRKAHGLSVVHGHTHRAQDYVTRHPLTGEELQGHSPGCLSTLQPMWLRGPNDWTHGVSVLQERGELWGLSRVAIQGGRALTACGTYFEAGPEGSVLRGIA